MLKRKNNNYNRIMKILITIAIFTTLTLNDCMVTQASSGPLAIIYSSHCQNIGWQNSKLIGDVSGTTGQSLRMEAIKISLSGNLAGGIQYRAHCQNIGWQDWRSNGSISGTVGQSRQMEAIQIKLTGGMENAYDVVYRVHVADYGWMSWKKNGETAGTTGQNRRIEAIQIKLQLKPYSIICKANIQLKKNSVAAYTRPYYIIDATGTKYLAAVAFDKNNNIVSYAIWNMPIDK